MSRGSRLAIVLLVVGWVNSLEIHRLHENLHITSHRKGDVNRRSAIASGTDFSSTSPGASVTASSPAGALNGTPAANITVSELEGNGRKRWRLPFLRTMFQRLVEQRRKRGLQRSKREADTADNLFDTPVGKALLDSLSKGYTREKGLGNGIGDAPVFGKQPPADKLWPENLNDDKLSRENMLFGPKEPFSLTVRRALMDSLCYPGDGNSKSPQTISDTEADKNAVDPVGNHKDSNKVLRRLKRYLEIVRVKVHPGEAKTLDALTVGDRENPNNIPTSQFLEPVPHDNREFHTGVAQSKLHASRDSVLKPRPLQTNPNRRLKGKEKGRPNTGQGPGSADIPVDIPPSLLESLSSLLSSLDTGLADIVAGAAHSNGSSRTLVRRERPIIEEHLVQQHPEKLPHGMEELVEQLDRKSKRKWAYEKTDALGEMHHVSHLAPNENGVISTNERDTQVLKKIHHYNVPAYKHELREAREMLEKLQSELDKRKTRWMA